MKLSPMVLQGLWEFKSPFLQLPFVTEDHLRLFMTKKRHIKNLQQFAQLKPDESRHILKHLSELEYENVMKVLGRMPLIDFSIRCEGKVEHMRAVYTLAAAHIMRLICAYKVLNRYSCLQLSTMRIQMW